MTDQEIVAHFLNSYNYEEGVTVDSNGQGPRRHLPLSQEIRDEFDKRNEYWEAFLKAWDEQTGGHPDCDLPESCEQLVRECELKALTPDATAEYILTNHYKGK
jgi:hypothetical protein